MHASTPDETRDVASAVAARAAPRGPGTDACIPGDRRSALRAAGCHRLSRPEPRSSSSQGLQGACGPARRAGGCAHRKAKGAGRAVGRAKRPASRYQRRRDEKRLFSQNCLGLKTPSRVAEFTDTFQQRHAFAAFLQETWREGKEVLPCDGGCVLIGVGPDVQTGRGSKGVAIVLSSSAAAAWRAAGAVVHDGFGSRVLAVPLAVKDPLSGSRLDVLLVSAYAPVSTADSEVWDAYYDALSRAIAAAPAGATIVVGTDANASVGRGSLGGPADDHADAVGPFGIEHINGSGRRLRTFLVSRLTSSPRSPPSSRSDFTAHGSTRPRSRCISSTTSSSRAAT